MKTLKRLFSYFVPYLGIMILYLFMGAVLVSLAMLLPQITKHITGSVILDAPFSFFGWSPKNKGQLFLVLAIAWLTIVIIRQSIGYLRGYLMVNSSIKAVCRMREDIFDRMLWQSVSFIQKENTGNILTILIGDTEIIKNFFTGTLPTIIEAIFGFIFASVMIWQMSPLMVIVAYLFTIPLFIISRRMSKVFFKWYHFVRDSSADLSTVTQENLNGIRIVKAYAQEKQEIKKFAEKNGAYRYHAINYMVVYCKEYIPFAIISHIPNIVLTVIAALLVVNGNVTGMENDAWAMTVAEFIAVGGYVGYILVPFQQANNWINAAQQAATSGEKVFRFLSIGSTISSKPNAEKPDVTSVHLKLDDVSFSHEGKKILNNISIDLPQGKTLGIVGTTGSGKTMLTNIMARFFDPTSGEVTINGVNVKDMDLITLRSCFSPVLQDVFLFSDTIAKNIAFGKPNATYDDVRRCAEVAQAHEFISKMPDEYETIVGERGMGLSGGQKQRISIARALLYNSPILVFDDATSALDMETEQLLYKRLKEEYSKQSRIIIAHRISSVKDCDEIIVLEKGNIIERGTHDELVNMKGHYYEIYKEQYSTVLEAL